MAQEWMPTFRSGSMVGSYSSGLGQFFAAEKLAGQARLNEADDIVWTAKEKVKFWGGARMLLGWRASGWLLGLEFLLDLGMESFSELEGLSLLI